MTDFTERLTLDYVRYIVLDIDPRVNPMSSCGIQGSCLGRHGKENMSKFGEVCTSCRLMQLADWFKEDADEQQKL